MGIYPTVKRITTPKWDKERQLYVWTEERDLYDGAKYRREVTATQWEEYKRETCYCCSCPREYFGSTGIDPYCRNHGFAGSRTCERHGIRGSGIDPEYNGGRVALHKLNTVQQENADNEAAYEAGKAKGWA